MRLLKSVVLAAKQNSNLKGRIVVCSYVFMRYFRVRMTNAVSKVLFSPIIIIYKFITDFLLKCEIPASTSIGEGLVIHHATGLVLNNGVVIGKNVTLKHHTTIGNKESLEGVDLGSPIIGDNVIIGPQSIIIGPIVIGNNSIIGAGSVVVKDVPPFSVVAGNPAKVIRFLNSGPVE
jgi:putative colanic acid biosynthesis acetyltransferase WcaB